MRVVFTNEVLEHADSWPWLDRIIETVEDGWHLWEVPEPDTIEASGWFLLAPRKQAGLRDLVAASIRRGAWGAPHGPHALLVIVDVTSMSPCLLDAKLASRALREPLHVIMENATSDGSAFLDAVLDVLGSEELTRLRKNCQPPPIRYEGPGGSGELTKRLDQMLEDPAWQGIPRRIVVLTDSDAAAPGKPSAKAQQIEAHCQRRGVLCHVLRKRAIENYLPQEVLEDWCSHPDLTAVRDRVAAIGRLSDEQRDHFPMKSGLKKLPPADRQLYEDARPEDLHLVEAGFGKHVCRLFGTHRTRMTPDALRTRAGRKTDGATELDELVALICYVL